MPAGYFYSLTGLEEWKVADVFILMPPHFSYIVPGQTLGAFNLQASHGNYEIQKHLPRVNIKFPAAAL